MEITEVWKDCVGYEGLYRVASLGRVYSTYTKKCLKPRLMENGYLQVWLTTLAKGYLVRKITEWVV